MLSKSKKLFKFKGGNLKTPVFFPDATRAVIRTLDFEDVESTKTPGVLVNTYHLYRELGQNIFKKFEGVKDLMSWDGAVISDSGGFQVMSLAKKGMGKVVDEGVYFYPTKGKKILLSPENKILVAKNVSKMFPGGIISDTMNSPPKDKFIILYCTAGLRSEEAGKRMLADGYKYIFNWGDILDWSYELETSK